MVRDLLEFCHRAMQAYVDAKVAEEREDFPTDEEEEEEEEEEVEEESGSDLDELSEAVARNFLSDDSDD